MENTTQNTTSGNEHNFPQFHFAKQVLAEIEDEEALNRLIERRKAIYGVVVRWNKQQL